MTLQMSITILISSINSADNNLMQLQTVNNRKYEPPSVKSVNAGFHLALTIYLASLIMGTGGSLPKS
jgi:hypothetical protein